MCLIDSERRGSPQNGSRPAFSHDRKASIRSPVDSQDFSHDGDSGTSSPVSVKGKNTHIASFQTNSIRILDEEGWGESLQRLGDAIEAEVKALRGFSHIQDLIKVSTIDELHTEVNTVSVRFPPYCPHCVETRSTALKSR